jgi:N-acetylmuramoyl-L-alanine amidase
MPSVLWRIVTTLVAVGLTGLCVQGLDRPGESSAWAASVDPSYSHQKKTKRAKGSHAGLVPVPLRLTTIENLRTATSSGVTRLVLDLDRRTKAPKPPTFQNEGVTIELPNATLGKSAQAKLSRGSIAKPFVIAQTSDHTVSVSLPSGSYQTYKMISLANPPRLVVDIVLPDEQIEPAPAQVQSEPSLPFELPPQPVQPKAKTYRTIVIDPGHGGRDPGAHGVRGTAEKDVTLKVGLKLRDILSKQPGVRVLMTRERDVFVELEDRAKFANSNDADLFVSVHVNSHPQRSVRGIEIYHFGEAKDQRALEVAARENGTPLGSSDVGWEYLVADLLTTKKIEASLELAWNTKEAMIGHLNGHYALVDHGVKTAPFYVLRFTSMPSILAEIAYVSNASEEELLRTNSFLTRIAESLCEGVKSYLLASRPPAR